MSQRSEDPPSGHDAPLRDPGSHQVPSLLEPSAVWCWGARWSLTLPSPHSELLEDLEGSSSAGGIAECFVQRVS